MTTFRDHSRVVPTNIPRILLKIIEKQQTQVPVPCFFVGTHTSDFHGRLTTATTRFSMVNHHIFVCISIKHY